MISKTACDVCGTGVEEWVVLEDVVVMCAWCTALDVELDFRCGLEA